MQRKHWQNSISIYDKSLNKVGIEGTYLPKAIYDNPTADTILTVEKLSAFPLRCETRQGCPLLSVVFFFNIVLEQLYMKNERYPNRKGNNIITTCR